jgi:hypothetical protein
MGSSTKANKIIAVLGIFFGMLAFAPLFTLEKSKLILINHTFFLVRYFKIILLLNGSLFFIVLGVLFYTGFLVPYFYANTYEKAKIHLVSGILSAPTWVSISITLFIVAKSSNFETIFILLIVLWVVLIAYFSYSIHSSLKVLKEGH